MPSRQVEALPGANRFAHTPTGAPHDPASDERFTADGLLYSLGQAGLRFFRNTFSPLLSVRSGLGGPSPFEESGADPLEEFEFTDAPDLGGIPELAPTDTLTPTDQFARGEVGDHEGSPPVPDAPMDPVAQGASNTRENLQAQSRPSRRLSAVKTRGKRYYTAAIQRAADAQGIDPRLLAELVSAESNYDQLATSPKGAQGLTQLMPATQRAYGVTDPFDADQSLSAGAKMLSELLGDYDGDELRAMTAYNWGSGNLAKFGMDKRPAETVAYTDRILSRTAAARR